MLALGTLAPDFSLPDVASGRTVSLADFSDKNALLGHRKLTALHGGVNPMPDWKDALVSFLGASRARESA